MFQNDEDETHQAENNETTLEISELPGKPFSLTVEFPLFLNMLSFGLAGDYFFKDNVFVIFVIL